MFVGIFNMQICVLSALGFFKLKTSVNTSQNHEPSNYI